MTDWSTNYTVFVGPKTVLDDISSAITDTHDFDFNQILPTPEIISELNAPTYAIPDAEFADNYNLDTAPTTLDELRAFIDTQQSTQSMYDLQDVPETAYRALIEAYGRADWHNWCTHNWGTKWIGDNADAQRCHDNLLIITYDTAGSPPTGIFSYLRSNYENMHIINRSDIEGPSDSINASDGSMTAFLTYFTSISSVEIEPSDFNHLPGLADTSDEVKQSVDIWYTEQCEINTDNINALIEHGCLVGEKGHIIRITDIEPTT